MDGGFTKGSREVGYNGMIGRNLKESLCDTIVEGVPVLYELLGSCDQV